MTYWLEGTRLRPQARQSDRPNNASSLLGSSRARLRFALLLCIAVAAFLGFVVFPPRRLAVSADGDSTVVVSRQKDVAVVLNQAGLKQQAGDVVVESGHDLNVERAVPVTVQVDGRTLSWRTRASTVADLLNELSIDVSPYDGIFINGFQVGVNESLDPNSGGAAAYALAHALSPGGEGLQVSIQRAVPLTIIEDGLPISLHSFQPTLGQALNDAGITLGPADQIDPSVSTPVTAGMAVVVKHAKAVSVSIGDSTQVIYTQQNTLQAALAEAGLDLGPDDRVEPSLDAPVVNGMTARLVRVAGRDFTEKETVQHKTVFKPDDSLSGSATRIVQGSDGVMVSQYHVTIEDGVEVSRELVSQTMSPDVVDTVIYYAADTVRSTGLPADDFNVVETKSVYATWYDAASSGKAATDPSYGITYSGAPVTRGVVAVDPSVIPLGSRLYIPGYGFAVAGDTGGGIVGNMIDLGYPDGVPVDWHTGWVDIYVLGS